MKTLKQIREEYKQKYGIPLSDKEQNECFKEWLTQKRQEDVGYDNFKAFHINNFLDELIKELEET